MVVETGLVVGLLAVPTDESKVHIANHLLAQLLEGHVGEEDSLTFNVHRFLAYLDTCLVCNMVVSLNVSLKLSRLGLVTVQPICPGTLRCTARSGSGPCGCKGREETGRQQG